VVAEIQNQEDRLKMLDTPRDAKWMFKENCKVAPGV